MDTPTEFPRSAYDLTGGIVYFARMLHKIRLHAAGRLPADYIANLGAAFDARCCRFLRVDYAALRERTLAGGSDAEILDWCLTGGRRPDDEEILVWNSFMRKRGWRDDDGGSEILLKRKLENRIAHRDDIASMFDYFDIDEGRRA